MPFCHVTLRGRKPREVYPEEPKTIGEPRKKRRLDLGLRQRDVALRVNAAEQTVCNWEKGRTEPGFRHYPALIAFLRYDPLPKGETLGERIRATRRRQGLSQEQLAQVLGIDQATVWAWEMERVCHRYPRLIRLFEEYVAKK